MLTPDKAEEYVDKKKRGKLVLSVDREPLTNEIGQGRIVKKYGIRQINRAKRSLIKKCVCMYSFVCS